MDEAMDDELTMVGAPDGAHILRKEHEYLLEPSNSNVVESHALVIPRENDKNESSTHFFADILVGKHMDRIGSLEQASVSPRCTDDSRVRVEELTFKTYNGENLAIVDTANIRERLLYRQNQWNNFYQRAGGSGSGGLHGETINRGKSLAISSVKEEDVRDFFPGFLDQDQKPSCENRHVDKNLPSNIFSSHVTRTKILSKDGSSEYFIKNSLKRKGVIYKGPAPRGSGYLLENQPLFKSTTTGFLGTSAPVSSTIDNVMPIAYSPSDAWPSVSTNPYHDGITLRDWIKARKNKANKMEILNLFRQIVKLLEISHSQGVALSDLHPSCFKLLPLNQIIYLGSSVRIDHLHVVLDPDNQRSGYDQIDKRPLEQNLLPFDHHCAKKQKLCDDMIYSRKLTHFDPRSELKSTSANVSKGDNFRGLNPRNLSSENHNQKGEIKSRSRSGVANVSDMPPLIYNSVSHMSEEKWYSSPEQLSGRRLTFSSNIYSLGVLLFELLSSFDCKRSHEAAMSDLRRRILPPDFLSKNPKEAGFCLWLLLPEPSSRPTTREILESGVIFGIQDLAGDEFVSSIEEQDTESELLLYFLLSLKGEKQNDALKLTEEIRFIESDIEEVEKRRTKESQVCSIVAQESSTAKGNGFPLRGVKGSDFVATWHPLGHEKLKRNIQQLENAYFSMRSSIQLSKKDGATRGDAELLRIRENFLSGKDGVASKTTDQLGGFYTDLCKYARYSKFRVRGVLRNGDLANSANVICSLCFDRDEDYLAAGGVSKKIKIFEFHSLLDDSVDIHYPVVEMSNKSKLSCICWNSYIRNYLASTDFDGAVKLWDAATGQGFSEYIEHDERAWSVDFSRLDPRKFASGSDDRLVKLWSINERNSLCTIRNHANVCCVQFSADSSYFLACSSADYKIYCYDLRNISTPWCILAGHEKAVSYAKFLDSETLVSASTDNSLKIWDLKKTISNGSSRDACVLTLRGHTNEKNFVGLSVADGYLACGSETNEVFAYYRSLPMPITSAKFGSIDPISGKDTDDDNGKFVSSVCWRSKSNMVVAANSTGSIKLLEMV